MQPEQWRAVVGFEGFYEVSDLGWVRAKDRTFLRLHNRTARLVEYTYKAHPVSIWIGSETGYPMVDLRANGRRKKQSVHVLVLEAFVGPRPAGCVACHRDGSRTNNAESNLRWDTYAGNEADKIGHDTHIRGERNSRAKLTRDDVLTIRASLEKQQVLADRFNVSQVCISLIQLRKNWKWLGQEAA